MVYQCLKTSALSCDTWQLQDIHLYALIASFAFSFCFSHEHDKFWKVFWGPNFPAVLLPVAFFSPHYLVLTRGTSAFIHYESLLTFLEILVRKDDGSTELNVCAQLCEHVPYFRMDNTLLYVTRTSNLNTEGENKPSITCLPYDSCQILMKAVWHHHWHQLELWKQFRFLC